MVARWLFHTAMENLCCPFDDITKIFLLPLTVLLTVPFRTMASILRFPDDSDECSSQGELRESLTSDLRWSIWTRYACSWASLELSFSSRVFFSFSRR